MSSLLMGRAFYTDLPQGLKLLLLALCDHANDDGSGVHAGQKRLAKKVGATDRTVRTGLASLRDMGYVVRVARGSANGRAGTPDAYRVIEASLPTTEQIKLIVGGTPEVSSADDVETPETSSADNQEHRKPRVGTPETAASTKPSVEPSVEPLERAPASRPRRQGISEDWLPTRAMLDWASQEFPALDVDFETEKFVDHFVATGKPMKDWDRAWRNWIRRAKDFSHV